MLTKEQRIEALNRLVEKYGLTNREIADRLIMSQSIVEKWTGPACPKVIPESRLMYLALSIRDNPPTKEEIEKFRPGPSRLFNKINRSENTRRNDTPRIPRS